MTRRGRYSPENLIRTDDLPFTPGQTVSLPALLDNPEAREEWELELKDPSVPKVLDLFCGAGGMSAGFVDAGFAVVAGIDHDLPATQTFAANIPSTAVCTD